MGNRAFRGIIIFCLLFLSGCATTQKTETTPTFQVDVDAISSHDAESKKKYILLSGIKDVKDTDLQFLEYSNYVDKALASRLLHQEDLSKLKVLKTLMLLSF